MIPINNSSLIKEEENQNDNTLINKKLQNKKSIKKSK